MKMQRFAKFARALNIRTSVRTAEILGWRWQSSSSNLLNPADMVNLKRYPLHRMNEEPCLSLIKDCRRALEESGVCILSGFLHDTALTSLAKEIHPLVPTCFRTDNVSNIWNEEPSGKRKETGQLRVKINTTIHGVVSHDELSPQSALKVLHGWEPFLRFSEQVLSAEEPPIPIFPLQDELASSVVNVLMDGHRLAWRFLDHPLEAIIVLQTAQEGGVFSLMPNVGPKLESDDDLASDAVSLLLNIEEVQNEMRDLGIELSAHDVMEDMDVSLSADYFKTGPFAIRSPRLEPGALLLVTGRKALMSISPVIGRQPVLLASMRFTHDPTFSLSPAQRQRLFGRTRASQPRKRAESDEKDSSNEADDTEMWKMGADGQAERVQSPELLEALRRARQEDAAAAAAAAAQAKKKGKAVSVPPLPPVAGEFSYLDEEADRPSRY